MTDCRKVVLFSTLIGLLGACAPNIDVIEQGTGGFAFSTRVNAETLETECAPGFSRLFPTEPAYILRPGQDTARIWFNTTSRSSITDAQIGLVATTGRFDRPDDLPVGIIDVGDGLSERAYVRRFSFPVEDNTYRHIHSMDLRPNPSSSEGAKIQVTATNRFNVTQTELVSIRVHDTECRSDQ